MQLVYVEDQPYLIKQLTKPMAIASPNRKAFVAKPGDYIMVDRWMNTHVVASEVMDDFLQAKDGHLSEGAT